MKTYFFDMLYLYDDSPHFFFYYSLGATIFPYTFQKVKIDGEISFST